MQPFKSNQLCFVAVLAALLAGCSPPSHGPGGPPISQLKGKSLPVPVTAAPAIQKDLPVELTAIGAARAFASISVKSRVDGQLARVAFKQGDEVKKGDLIFQIDSRPFQAALSQAEAILARDAASLTNAEADMRRTDELAGTKAVPATLIDANRAKAATFRASVEADKAAIESARLQLSFCSITSPVNGRLGLLLVDEGNMVKNNDTILATINQIRPIYADFSVPEQFLPQIREAAAAGRLQVKAAAPRQTGPPATGELDVINNQVDSGTGTIMLRAQFPNSEEQLWPGQFLNLTLTLGRLTNATVVPSQAVQTSQNGEFVFVVKPDNTVEKRLVTLGLTHADEAVIQSGVKPDETVVTDGQLRLVPGAKVDIKAAGGLASEANESKGGTGEIRNPNPEIRKKSEIRIPKSEGPKPPGSARLLLPGQGVPPSGGETELIAQSHDSGTGNYSSVPPAKAGTPCQNPHSAAYSHSDFGFRISIQEPLA